MPQLVSGATVPVVQLLSQSRPTLFPSGPVTCCWPVPTLGVYPALLFLRRTAWSSGDPVLTSLRKKLVADVLPRCPALLSGLVARIRTV
ncbi:hypothetical protein E2C01_051952 [Portunus trituberculatus]|uniref:Uncharacterized protein n=1 Tax=Portunus trituberculatus TaxID=210409 RepID=A0A5B7GCC8_PORTR|nr:hypothetical protein [Portunus trituberculatus]